MFNYSQGNATCWKRNVLSKQNSKLRSSVVVSFLLQMRCQIKGDYYDDEYEYYDDTNNNANANTNVAEDYYEDNDADAVIFPSSQAASSDFFSGGDSTHLYPAYRDSQLRYCIWITLS